MSSDFFIVEISYAYFYRILGTPSEESWPGVTALQDWNESFPIWPTLNLTRFNPGMDENGLDLLEVRQQFLFH
jgi:cyclin-dependent kinase